MKWCCLIIAAGVACAQPPDRSAPLQFDVSSVRLVKLNGVVPSRITADRGRLNAQSVTTRDLIAYAYDVQSVQIADSKSMPERYDIEGKTEGAYSGSELRGMLKGLLTDRFHLKFHRETRELAVDRLVIGRDLKLKAATLAEADPRGFSLRASEKGPAFLRATASAMSLAWFANDLSGHLSRLVVDSTGLEGLFEFDVDFEIDRSEATDANVPVRDVANHIRESLVSAMGLKLEGGRKERVEMLVIDRVQRPDAN